MKIRHFIFAAMAFIVCAACQEKNITPDVPVQNQEVYTVQLGFGGEWDVTYEPLTRGNDNNDLYGIQVYSAPIMEGNTTWSYYAYGLFDDINNVSISLLKGFKYKFEATMVVDGKNKLKLYSFEYGYNDPFDVYGITVPNLPMNEFQYSVQAYFEKHKYGTTYLNGAYYQRPNTERYYGELVDYIPEESSNDKAKIHMMRTSFGAKFIAQGKLATTGRLEILMSDAPAINIDLTQEKQHTDIYSFSSLKEVYNYKTGNYSEDIKVAIYWHYENEDGTTPIVPLGTHHITYKRNATTVVKVNLENTNVEGGVGFELMEAGAMEDGPEYEINDGDNVDTEIDTNK